MNKIKNFKVKLAITIGVALYLYVWIRSGMPCLVKKYLHIPCPVCGMTRAWEAAVHLDLKTAFTMHPMFWTVPILAMYILYDAEPFKNKVFNRTVLVLILAGIMIHYGVVLVRFFGIV